jgi:hypothetical protein
MMTARRDGIQILHPPQELDLTTAGCLATRATPPSPDTPGCCCSI